MRLITYYLSAGSFDVDLLDLLSRRLTQCGVVSGVARTQSGVSVTIREGEGVIRFAEALTKLLCRDLVYFVLAQETDRIAVPLDIKQLVLKLSLRRVLSPDDDPAVTEALLNYLMEERILNLEGYLTFRMRETVGRWRIAVLTSAEEICAEQSYTDMLDTLASYLNGKPTRLIELSACIHPDGSLTLSDETGVRIEYADCTEDGVLGMLVSMAPERLTVYDLSEGTGTRLISSIRRVFSGRVRVYR